MTTIVKSLILASTSPFRKKLLERLGVEFIVESSNVDESKIIGDDPKTLSLLRAKAKSLEVSQRFPESLVIGCDQICAQEKNILHKVKEVSEAREVLRLLSGKTHHLHSAVAISCASNLRDAWVISVAMNMRKLSSEEIEAYLKTGEWKGCAGCYKFESIGVQLFDGVDCEESAIVGLPLTSLSSSLRKFGINPILQKKAPWYF